MAGGVYKFLSTSIVYFFALFVLNTVQISCCDRIISCGNDKVLCLSWGQLTLFCLEDISLHNFTSLTKHIVNLRMQWKHRSLQQTVLYTQLRTCVWKMNSEGYCYAVRFRSGLVPLFFNPSIRSDHFEFPGECIHTLQKIWQSLFFFLSWVSFSSVSDVAVTPSFIPTSLLSSWGSPDCCGPMECEGARPLLHDQLTAERWISSYWSRLWMWLKEKRKVCVQMIVYLMTTWQTCPFIRLKTDGPFSSVSSSTMLTSCGLWWYVHPSISRSLFFLSILTV